MSNLNRSISNCRFCQYFTPLGQRGGTCKLLSNGFVKNDWKACSFSNPAFNILDDTKYSSYALLSR